VCLDERQQGGEPPPLRNTCRPIGLQAPDLCRLGQGRPEQKFLQVSGGQWILVQNHQDQLADPQEQGRVGDQEQFGLHPVAEFRQQISARDSLQHRHQLGVHHQV